MTSAASSTTEPGCIVCGAYVGHGDSCLAYLEELREGIDLYRGIGQRILDGLEANARPGGNTNAYWAAIQELREALGGIR